MILFLTDRPLRYRELNRHLTIQNVQLLPCETERLRPVLRNQGVGLEVNGIFLDYQSEHQKGILLEVNALLEETIPLIVVFDRITARELIELAEEGIHHFLHCEKFLSNRLDPYLYRILQRYRSRQLFQNVRTHMERIFHEEFVKTHGLLDALQFGIMIVSPADSPDECFIQNVNRTLEQLLETELKAFEGLTLGDLQRAPGISPAIREMFQLDLSRTRERETGILPFEKEGYLERVVSPYFGEEGSAIGYILLFRDVSYEVESGLLNPITGLPGRGQGERALAKTIRRYERSSDTPCRLLSLSLLEIGRDEGSEHPLQESEYRRLLWMLAGIIKNLVGDEGIVSNSHNDRFMVLMPCCDARRMSSLIGEIALKAKAFPPLLSRAAPIAAGTVFGSFEDNLNKDREEYLSYLHRHTGSHTVEAEQALHRSRLEGDNRAVFYSRNSGYSDFDLAEYVRERENDEEERRAALQTKSAGESSGENPSEMENMNRPDDRENEDEWFFS